MDFPVSEQAAEAIVKANYQLDTAKRGIVVDSKVESDLHIRNAAMELLWYLEENNQHRFNEVINSLSMEEETLKQVKDTE